MKKIKMIMMVIILAMGLMIVPGKVSAAVENLTENVKWEGTIDEEILLSFTPESSGFYSVKLNGLWDESEEKFTQLFMLDGRTDEEITGITPNDDCIFYLKENRKYYLQIEVKSYDDLWNEIYDEGKVEVTLSKYNKEIKTIGSEEVSETVPDVGDILYKVVPENTGTYTFTSSRECMLEVYNFSDDAISELKRYGYADEGYKSYKLQLIEGQSYYISVYSPYNEGKDIYIKLEKDNKDISGFTVNNYNETIHSGMLSPNVDYSYYLYEYFEGFNPCAAYANITVLFSDGSSEIISDDETAEKYGVSVEYIGEEDDEHFIKSGKQLLKITILGCMEQQYFIDVLKKVDVCKKTIIAGEKITTTSYYPGYVFYKVTPKESGYYTIWSKANETADDVFDNYWYRMYDANDNEIEWTQGEGFKLKAGETYCFYLYLGCRNDNYSSYTFWLDINTDHTHIWGNWFVHTPATVLTTGLEKRICALCEAEEVRTIAKLNGDTSNIGSNGGTVIKNDSATNPSSMNNNPAVNKKKIVSIGRTKIKKASLKGKNKIYLTWGKVNGATKYEIQYSTSKKFKKAKKKIVSGKKITIKGLKKNKKYYVKVRAYTTVDGKKVYGRFSAVKKIKTKK